MIWPLEDAFWVWWITALSGLMFVGTLIVIPFLIVRIPDNYFIRRPVRDWPARHPLVHVALIIGKNFLGVALVMAGIAMLVLPGQGLLTILVGLMFVDFPGKRRWELRMIRIKPVREAANWIRKKYGRKPLILKREDRSCVEEGH